MPTILELFKGSSKDISPKILDKTPLSVDDTKQIDKKGLYFDANVYTSGTNYSLVKSKKPPKNKTFNTVSNFVEQEIWGIRFKSAVELNNPLIYGNQAIRIATRSTSAVEQMKAGTGGEGADGGLIGQGLGKITGGKFGEAVFGGKVTSLNQARDGINGKLGIPTLTIPTYVNNTGELQKGIEPDTMITIAKIKNDAAGTELGKFLKQTGGGKPQTIATQALGQGVSFVKDKLREKLFGNPASMGSNTATPANGGYIYSSQTTYSERIRDVKNQEQDETKLAIDKATGDALKKANELKEEGKQKLGKVAGDASNKLKGTSKLGNKGASAIDAAIEENTQNPAPSPDLKYSETLGNYKVEYQEANTPIIDLSLVSPIYGVDRKSTSGRYGKTQYGFSDIRNNTGIYSPYNPTEGSHYTDINKNNFQTLYGLDNGFDRISESPIQSRSESELTEIENQDLIPFWIKSQRSSRTAHFRSYITGISETVSPSWSSSKFFGNPFNFYTYDGVERSVAFNLKVVALNKSELASNWEKIEFLTQQAYPTFKDLDRGIYTQPPIISFRLGSMYKDKIGYIESLSHSIPDNSPWETNIEGLLLPKFIDIAITIKFIEQHGSQSTIYNIKRTTDAIQLINETNSNQGGSFTTDSISTSEQPAKVDEYGVTAKPENEGGVNKSPTNLETGEKAPTPQEKESGEVIPPTNTTSAVVEEKDERMELIKQKLPNASDYIHRAVAREISWDIDSIKLVPENGYYRPHLDKAFYVYNKNGSDRDWGVSYSETSFSAGSWRFWVTYNNRGYDPLGILEDLKDNPPPPQPAPVPPIDESKKKRKKKR